MIVYADTSALLKNYVAEERSAEVRKLFAQATRIALSRIAWAEAHAAFARRAREAPRDAAPLATARKALAADWPHYGVVEVSQAVVERAGEYAEGFALRGYDGVQLATARLVQEWAAEPVSFACFDSRLNQAAAILGMKAVFV